MSFIDLVINDLVTLYQPYCAKCGGGLSEKSFSFSKKTKNMKLLVIKSRCQICSCSGRVEWNYPAKQPNAGETIVLLATDSLSLSFESVLQEAKEILGLTC